MVPSSIDELSPKKPRVVPLALKLGAATVIILGIASVLAASELARRERASLVASKLRATEQITELFATYDSAALAFADSAATEDDIRGLGRMRDIVYAAVWSVDAETPIASTGPAGDSVRRPGTTDATRTFTDRIEVVRRVTSPEGDVLGVALVRVSLAPENRAYEASRTRIRSAVVGSALVLAAILALALSRLVTRPIAALVAATRRVEKGERSDLDLGSNDEVGELARAFSRMAGTIADREASLRATTERLQKVLDHMGQAILVFDAAGSIDSERSREASTIIGASERAIADVLYPAHVGLVEREAFEAWVNASLGVSAEEFEAISDLAPSEAEIFVNGKQHVYRLDFRPIVHDDRVDRIMLVATDITAERQLRADVARKDEEHQKRVAAMRRLVAGGGQVFVRFLESARYRIRTSRTHLALVSPSDRHDVGEVFRHVHTLRGEARCFDLDTIESRLARIEFELADVRTRNDPRFDLDAAKTSIDSELERTEAELGEAESLFVAQSPVGAAILDQVTVRKSDLVALETLAGTTNAAVAAIALRLSSRPFGESVFLVAESVPRWIARESKSAELAVEGRDVPVPPNLSRVLPGVLAHLVRNAIAHGIETPDVRALADKPERATIGLVAEPFGGSIRVVVRDDGRGFDVEAMRAKAEEAGLGAGADVQTMLGRVGSTRTGADELAGHGVGLDAVRVELASAGYAIRLESTSGVGAALYLEPTAAPRGALG